MEQKEITTVLHIYDHLDELPEEVRKLFEKAIAARENAYAPYSGYKVGAAILLESGQIVTGNNQENAAYPSGLCAERTALFYAGANFPKQKMHTLVISVKSVNKLVDQPAAPCGSCRQAIAEYEFKQNRNIEIYMSGETGKIIKVDSLAAILPLAFNSSFM